MPIYLQSLRGRTALQTGVILLANGHCGASSSPCPGRSTIRSARARCWWAAFCFCGQHLAAFEIRADTPLTWILFLLVLRGLALGMTVQTTMVTALSWCPGKTWRAVSR